MIAISSELRQALQNGTVLHEEITMTLPDETVLTLDEEIMQGENTIVDQADSSSFPVGAAICKYITFTLDNSRGQYEGVSFFGAVCDVSLKATVNNVVERIPKGRYTVLSPVSYGEIIEITAADEMYKADKTYATTLTLPQTIFALVQDACSYCDITCGFSSMTNGSLQITELPEDMTFREFFGYAAAIAGGNARIDVENRLQFVSWNFSTENPYELRDFSNSPVISADEIQITGVQVSVGDVDEEQFLYGDAGYVIAIENPLCKGICEAVATAVGMSLVGWAFRSMEGEIYADPTIETGDMAVSFDRKGNRYLTPITDVSFSLFSYTAVKTQAEPPIRSESLFTSTAAQTLASAKRLLSIYAENGYFSGELRAARGAFTGEVAASKFILKESAYTDEDGNQWGSDFYTSSDGMHLKCHYIKQVTPVQDSPSAYIDIGGQKPVWDSEHESILYYEEQPVAIYGKKAVDISSLYGITISGMVSGDINIESSAGEINLSTGGTINLKGNSVATGNITIPNSRASFRALDSNGDAKNLIYMSGADVVTINGGTAKTSATAIGTNTTVNGTLRASSHIYWGGATGWNDGVSGGFADSTGQMCIIGSDSSHLPRINFVTNKKTTSAGYTQLRVNNTGSTNYVLTLPNSTGTIATSSSDVRLKENIRPTEVSGLELIEKIRLKQFDWREEGREGSPHWHVGMIADELEALDSNLTFGGGMNDDGTMNVKGVDSFYLLGYVIKAVQELSAKVKEGAA